jgi:hypothetical protein
LKKRAFLDDFWPSIKAKRRLNRIYIGAMAETDLRYCTFLLLIKLHFFLRICSFKIRLRPFVKMEYCKRSGKKPKIRAILKKFEKKEVFGRFFGLQLKQNGDSTAYI